MRWPSTPVGILVSIVLGLALVTLLFTTGIIPALIVLAVAALLAYVVYAIAVRVHRRLTTPGGST